MKRLHLFHIPVMATGHSIDTPIRLAPFGIDSVISLVDDRLIEKVRGFYCDKHDLPFEAISAQSPDARAKRITAYLDLVHALVQHRLEAIKAQPFGKANEKARYFRLLPDTSPLKNAYERLLNMPAGPERQSSEVALTEKMAPGSIDVNIMSKVDAPRYDRQGHSLGDLFSDARAALRGYANSVLESSIVFSAGINQGLYSYMAEFPDFYRDAAGLIKKKIILKVSSFRSARIQGRYLARKGLEVSEYRVESGLNCGGHAFASEGFLLLTLLQEFQQERHRLAAMFQKPVQAYYAKQGMPYVQAVDETGPEITVQGGIGTHGEMERMLDDLGMDAAGWATPFLLVPEATCVDDPTRELLRRAQPDDLYVSDVSPLNIPFNNIRGSGSELWTRQRIAAGTPGAPCTNGYGVTNTEYGERPICISSRQYQQKKLKEIAALDISDEAKERMSAEVMARTCICSHLGNGALIALGLAEVENAPQAICPGPNIAWFNELYSLEEMVDHIYGRGRSLVSMDRPHMLAQEMIMYVDDLAKRARRCQEDRAEVAALVKYVDNLRQGMDLLEQFAERSPYPGENLSSIDTALASQRARLEEIMAGVPLAET